MFERPFEGAIDRQCEPIGRQQLNEQFVVRLDGETILDIVQRDPEGQGRRVGVFFGAGLHADGEAGRRCEPDICARNQRDRRRTQDADAKRCATAGLDVA